MASRPRSLAFDGERAIPDPRHDDAASDDIAACVEGDGAGDAAIRF
jgi:hypothetical protein